MNISEELANMSDAQLAEVCGGDEPPPWTKKEVAFQTAHDTAERDGHVDIDGVRYVAVQDYDLDTQLVEPREVIKGLLRHIGENPERGGLLETPKRVVKAWAEWTAGYRINPAELLKTFEDGAEGVEELVIVKDIPFYSHCEHHLAPFFGTVSIGYVPNGKIVGLSKLGRLSDCFAKRLQVQERYTNQIATAIFDVLQPKFVGVVASARHMCIESRGAKQCGSSTTTSAFRGDMNFRSDFLGMIK